MDLSGLGPQGCVDSLLLGVCNGGQELGMDCEVGSLRLVDCVVLIMFYAFGGKNKRLQKDDRFFENKF